MMAQLATGANALAAAAAVLRRRWCACAIAFACGRVHNPSGWLPVMIQSRRRDLEERGKPALALVAPRGAQDLQHREYTAERAISSTRRGEGQTVGVSGGGRAGLAHGLDLRGAKGWLASARRARSRSNSFSIVISPILTFMRVIASSRSSGSRLLTAACPPSRKRSRHAAMVAAVTPRSRLRVSRSSPRRTRSTTALLRSPFGSLRSRRDSLPSPGSSHPSSAHTDPPPVCEESRRTLEHAAPPSLKPLVRPQPPILPPRPTHQVGVDASQEGMQRRPMKPAVIPHPPADDGAEPSRQAVRGKVDTLVHPHPAQFGALGLERLGARRRHERREDSPRCAVQRLPLPEGEPEKCERRVLVAHDDCRPCSRRCASSPDGAGDQLHTVAWRSRSARVVPAAC